MSKSASLSDKKFKLNVDIAKLESEVDIQKINDWTDKKYDNGAKMTPAEMSFYVAGEVFNERRVHSQHWLQSVYTKVCKEFKESAFGSNRTLPTKKQKQLSRKSKLLLL